MNLNKITVWLFAFLLIILAWLAISKDPTVSRAASFDPRNGVFTIQAPRGQEGTAFIIDDNFFVTNAHILEFQTDTNVFQLRALKDTSRYAVEPLMVDPETDIAFFKIADWDKFKTDEKWNKLELETAVVNVGDYVYALGSPMGMEGSMSDGIISTAYMPVLGPQSSVGHYTTAVINPGNSGGPLLNGQDKVVGINTLKINDVREYNFVISSDFVVNVLKEYKLKGSYDIKKIGGWVRTEPDGTITVVHMRPDKTGFFADIGLKDGDKLLKWTTEWTVKTNNETVFSSWFFNTQYIMGYDGQQVFAEIERNGQKILVQGTF